LLDSKLQLMINEVAIAVHPSLGAVCCQLPKSIDVWFSPLPYLAHSPPMRVF